MRTKFLVSGLSCLMVLSLAVVVRSQEKDSKASPQLPANPAVWINSNPISNDMLSGKAAVLFFFDAQDRGVSDGWARMLFTAQKFEGTPVMFIGVNSGSPRAQLEGYVKRNKIPWPVICDSDRSFENQFGIQVSPQATRQVRLLMPDGKFKSAEATNIEGAATDALRDAKWKVEPKDIPQALQSAWLAVEFGNYPAAAQTLKKNLNGKGELKDAAERLNQFVLDDLAGQLDVAKKSLDDGKKWDAFKRFSTISAKFKGFTIPPDVTVTLKELTTDDAIKEEQAAMRQFEFAMQAASRSPTARKGAIKQLEKLVKDHPDTEAASEAQKIIEQSGM